MTLGAATVVAVAAVAALAVRVWGLQRRVRLLERIDSLTGIANRAGFLRLLQRHIRTGSRAFAVAIIDCDSFKAINDSLGHLTGDRVLCSVAKVLSNEAGPRATAARIWGDAFGLILPSRDLEEAEKRLKCIQGELDRRMRQEGWPLTFSVGAVHFGPPFQESSEKAESLLATADSLMYRVKRQGRNGLVLRRAGEPERSGDSLAPQPNRHTVERVAGAHCEPDHSGWRSA